MPLLSEIRFGSYLVYSPSGKNPRSVAAKNICYAIKQDSSMRVGNPAQTVRAIPFLAQHLCTHLAGSELESLFRRRPVLVPAPRSSPLKPDSLCPTRLICQNLVAQGLGAEMQELLRRIRSVPKAAMQIASERPTVPQHYSTLEVDAELAAPEEVLVVDDVVTSGSMLLACVSKLQDSFPGATIRAFAFVRTMSGTEIEKIIEPCTGTIRLNGERSRRVP